MLEGTLRALVAQRSQLALRRLRGQADGVGVHPHHGGEQRAVEQLPVQVLDLQRGLAHVQLQLLHQGTLSPRGIPGTHATGGLGQPTALLDVILLRQRVGALQPVQLQAVLQQAHELIAADQHLAVLAAHIAAVDELAQGRNSGRDAQVLVGTTVDQLQELDGELHVAQAALPQLQLPLTDVCGHVLDDAAAHGLHVWDEVLPLRRGPHHRGDGLAVVPTELQVPAHRAGFEQGLELPGLGPAPVVIHVGIQRAHQRAPLALGPQGRIDLEEHPAADVDELARPAHRAGVRGLGDEDDVHVRDVVQLLGTALPHRQHRQPGGLLLVLRPRLAVDRAAGHREGSGQPRVRRIRER